jgi:divalent metal cation (Fe/Co/Zn/Cd) transporter
MNRPLSPLAIIAVSLLFIMVAYFVIKSSFISNFFTRLPFGALAVFGTMGGLIVTGLVIFYAKIAIKKRRK